MIVCRRFPPNAKCRIVVLPAAMILISALCAHIYFAFCMSHFAFPCASTNINDHLSFKKGIYIFRQIVYDNSEQSRRPRVKCHRDGELPGGRRMRSTMGSPHPLLHTGCPPLCSNDTRSGQWSAVSLPLPTGDPCPKLPDGFPPGLFIWIRRQAASAPLPT